MPHNTRSAAQTRVTEWRDGRGANVKLWRIGRTNELKFGVIGAGLIACIVAYSIELASLVKLSAVSSWKQASAAFVATNESSTILGTYYLKPNQPALGSHVCNCGYIVNENARGKGVASAMCEHSQSEAIARGFRAMQYNLVVSTNEGAVRLWKKHGFKVIGTLLKAFCDLQLGFVDAYVMYKQLEI